MGLVVTGNAVHRRARTAWLCLLVLAAVPAAAHPDVDGARALYRQGEFRRALKRLDAAQRSPALSEEDLVELHWLRALNCTALSDATGAAESFDRLLELRPLYEPDPLDTSPHVRALFVDRAHAFQAAHPVAMELPRFDGATASVHVEGELARVATVRLYARAPGDPAYLHWDLPRQEDQADGPIGSPQLWKRVAAAGRVEVVLEALSARGVPVARAGDALQPDVVALDAAAVAAILDALEPPPPAPPAAPAPVPEPAAVTSWPDPPQTAPAPALEADAEDEPAAEESPARAARWSEAQSTLLGAGAFLGGVGALCSAAACVAVPLLSIAFAIAFGGGGFLSGVPIGVFLSVATAGPPAALGAWLLNAWLGARRIPLWLFAAATLVPMLAGDVLGGAAGLLVFSVGAVLAVLANEVGELGAARSSSLETPASALMLVGAALLGVGVVLGLVGAALAVPLLLLLGGRARAPGEDAVALDVLGTPPDPRAPPAAATAPAAP